MKKIVIPCFIFAIVLSTTCKEAYVPPIVSTNDHYLVVEGFINNGPDSSLFHLTRSYKLDDTATLQPELHAVINVEGKDNSTYPLGELGNGYYATGGLALNNAVQYRVHIRTSNGKQYVSDFVPVKNSPPIDSISWTDQPSTGLTIYANTHDPQRATQYYRWEYEQTWQFNSIYFTGYQYNYHTIMVEPRAQDTFYTCWHYANSTNLLLYSTAKLDQDVVSRYPLVLIPQNSWEISLKYSIRVRQYALTADAYQFWLDLQKNSEQLGTIFSPEPFQTRGNLHCVTDTSELVLGYISAGTVQTQRIYILPYDIAGWHYSPYVDGCHIISIPNIKDSLEQWLAGFGYLPIQPSPGVPLGTRYDISFTGCIDCNYFGTNQKPWFWQ